jgi:hypothetical protein
MHCRSICLRCAEQQIWQPLPVRQWGLSFHGTLGRNLVTGQDARPALCCRYAWCVLCKGRPWPSLLLPNSEYVCGQLAYH